MTLSNAQRLSIYFAALFAHAGLNLPFWPIWLEAQGLDADWIGLILAAAVWSRVISTPIVGAWADRSGAYRTILAALGFGGALSFALMGIRDDPAWLLGFTILNGIMIMPTIALADNLTLMRSRQDGFDYARVRLWGSISFMVISVLAGLWLKDRDPQWIFILLLFIHGCFFLAALILPAPPPLAENRRMGFRNGFAALVRAPGFLPFILAAACLQSSHGMLYAFGSLHWRSVGLDEDSIGFLWAVGVIAEILLFFAASRLLTWRGPEGLLLMGAIAAVVRWGLMGHVDNFWLLLPLQILHALTFAAWHVGALHMVARLAPAHLQASAQGLYSTVGPGIGMGLVMWGGGFLYALLGGWAFTITALLPAISLIYVLYRLRKF